VQTKSSDLRLVLFNFSTAFTGSGEKVAAAGASSHFLSFSTHFSPFSEKLEGKALRESERTAFSQ